MNAVFSRGISVTSFLLSHGKFHNFLLNCNIQPFGDIFSKSISLSAVHQARENPADLRRRRALDIVDWLPFPWSRQRIVSTFERSGDLVKELEYDPSWPKPDFELSEELKTANDDIKHAYSLATASKGEIKEVIKRRLLERIQRHPTDLESPEVKVALKTIVVRSLFQHQREYKKERKFGRFVLDIQIKKRNKMLKKLREVDMDRFNWICDELQITYTPHKLGGEKIRYTRKNELRRLTKEHCQKLINEKKTAYHEELKRQQEEFLKEKEEILAWIEKEEKELANLKIDK